MVQYISTGETATNNKYARGQEALSYILAGFSSGLQLFCFLHTLEKFPQYPSEMLFLPSGCYLEIMTKQENCTGTTHFFLSVFCFSFLHSQIPTWDFWSTFRQLVSSHHWSLLQHWRYLSFRRMEQNDDNTSTSLVCCLRGAEVGGLTTLLWARRISLSCWIVNCNWEEGKVHFPYKQQGLRCGRGANCVFPPALLVQHSLSFME